LRVGSGGTFPIQALAARPAINTWHVAQSPFLHEYRGLIPICGSALERGVPGLKFFFLPLYDNTVIRRRVLLPLLDVVDIDVDDDVVDVNDDDL